LAATQGDKKVVENGRLVANGQSVGILNKCGAR
jgi:hypothetical protein